MSFNTFGKIFRFTTWGESHGPAIGCIIDGCPPNIAISDKEIFGGQPSTIQPIAGPCDSPQVVNLNIFPKVLKDIDN